MVQILYTSPLQQFLMGGLGKAEDHLEELQLPVLRDHLTAVLLMLLRI
jgi:hypothetical protein